jgi:hypothetical protein
MSWKGERGYLKNGNYVAGKSEEDSKKSRERRIMYSVHVRIPRNGSAKCFCTKESLSRSTQTGKSCQNVQEFL